MKFKNIVMTSLLLLAAGSSGATEKPSCTAPEQLVQIEKNGEKWYYCGKTAGLKCPAGQIRLEGQLFGEGCVEEFTGCKEGEVMVSGKSAYYCTAVQQNCPDGEALVANTDIATLPGTSTVVCKKIVKDQGNDLILENEKLGKKLGVSVSTKVTKGNEKRYYFGNIVNDCKDDQVAVSNSGTITGVTGTTACVDKADLSNVTLEDLRQSCTAKKKFFRRSNSARMWGCLDTESSTDTVAKGFSDVWSGMKSLFPSKTEPKTETPTEPKTEQTWG